MKNKTVVFIDIDDICALLMPAWLACYNRDYQDSLEEKNITDWNIQNFVKPECGTKIFDYIKGPEIYDYVIPREYARWGVNQLRKMGCYTPFATSAPIEIAGRKFHWLHYWGFLDNPREYIEISDKSLLHGDFMFDDNYGNVKNFSGKGYLLTRPWNKKFDWPYRVNDWPEFVGVMESNLKEIS